MKADELVRNVPAHVLDHHLALAGLPKNMKGKAHPKRAFPKRPLMRLRTRTTWPPGLVVTTPREPQTEISSYGSLTLKTVTLAPMQFIKAARMPSPR
jgi:hypothetical protein